MAPLFKGNPPNRKSSHPQSLPILHTHAAGIDLGARDIYVAVPSDSCRDNVRRFPTFTEDLHALRDWLGAPKAITAMAHKLARVLWHLLKFKEAFNPEVFAKEEAKMKRKKLQRLEVMATSLNYRIVPIQ